VLPVITPFSFGEDEFNLDDSTSTICSITKGDLPLKIWWTFKSDDDNEFAHNLTTGDGVIITRPSSKVSMITIEALKPRHRGTYSCYAVNLANVVVNQSAYLSINGSIFKHLNFIEIQRKLTSEFCNLIPLNLSFSPIEYFLSSATNESVHIW
jgi:hypothetical protein